MSYWPEIRTETDEFVNRQFDSPEYRRLFSDSGIFITP